LPRIMKNCTPKGIRNQGRPLKSLGDVWDRNGSTRGPILWQPRDDELTFKGALPPGPCASLYVSVVCVTIS
jgi:hypothetical protein